ncbi:MAG: hypothetical protein IJW05_12340 [Lentisphaeria bacterium]|nr:hypothetical protein [Lentisphaeria bacterium]
MAKSRISGAISDTKETIRILNSRISGMKSYADDIISGKRGLPSFYSRNTAETRKDYSKVYLKREGYQKLIAQRTYAQKKLADLERIKQMRKGK